MYRSGCGCCPGHKFSIVLCKTAEQFRPQLLVLRVLQQLQVGILAGGILLYANKKPSDKMICSLYSEQ